MGGASGGQRLSEADASDPPGLGFAPSVLGIQPALELGQGALWVLKLGGAPAMKTLGLAQGRGSLQGQPARQTPGLLARRKRSAFAQGCKCLWR